jgi:hypothetical protein
VKAIWRFDFDVADEVVLSIPLPARILPHVHANSPGSLTVWAEVTPGCDPVDRRLAVVGTGNPMPLGLGVYLGTAVAPPLVWHVFEVSS